MYLRIIILIFCLASLALQAQYMYLYDKNYDNSLQLSFNKLNNISTNVLLGNYFVENELGSLFVSQNLNSVTTINTRDDEAFSMALRTPISSKLDFLFTNNFIYNSVPNSPTVYGNLKRINLSGGAKWSYLENGFLATTLGFENNTFDEINSKGYIFNLTNRTENIKLDDYNMTFLGSASLLSLNKDRINSNYLGNLIFDRVFETEDNLRLDLQMGGANRDYFRLNSNNTENVLGRKDDFFASDVYMTFKLFDFLFSSVRFNYNNKTTIKDYRNIDSSLFESGIRQEINVESISLKTDVNFKFDLITQLISFTYLSRDEINEVQNEKKIGETDFNTLKLRQEQWNNLSNTKRLFLSTNYNFSKKDRLKLDYSISLYQYDTPSEQNTYDRDEFASILKLSYERIISNSLQYGIEFENLNNHIVNLKTSRSIDNNWNRIYRLTPIIRYNDSPIRYFGRFEVMANYTIFDYELDQSNTRSYSYRQVQYIDSLSITLGRTWELKNRILVRYFETGILFWADFAEKRINGKEEYFVNPILNHYVSDNFTVGIGFRYFKQYQRNLSSSSIAGTLNQYSIGPELQIAYILSSGNVINFSGWYEFLHRDDKLLNNFTNVSITTKILF